MLGSLVGSSGFSGPRSASVAPVCASSSPGGAVFSLGAACSACGACSVLLSASGLCRSCAPRCPVCGLPLGFPAGLAGACSCPRRRRRAWSLLVSCPSCGCRFSALSFGVRSRSLVFCASCGRFWFVPRARWLARGLRVAWSAGSLPARRLAPSLPPRQSSFL